MPDSGFRSIEHDPGRLPPEIDTSVAHPARRYDYWLGGKDNFPADRESGDAIAAVFPSDPHRRPGEPPLPAPRGALPGRGGRRSGSSSTSAPACPTSHNTHEVAQAVDPAVPGRLRRQRPDRAGPRPRPADQRTRGRHRLHRRRPARPREDPGPPGPARTLDLSQPVALLLVAILHFVPDADDPYGVVDRLLGALPSGSYLVVSHATADTMPPELVARIDAGTPRPGPAGCAPGRSSPGSSTGWSSSSRGSSPSRSGGPRTSPSLAPPSRTRRPMAPSRGSLDPPRPRPWRTRKPSPSSSGWSSASAWTSHSPCRSACGPALLHLARRCRWRVAKWSPWGAEMRSCSSAVLMEETAEPITAANLTSLTLADDVQTGGWIRRLQPERQVRTMTRCSGRHRPEAHAPGALARRSAASQGTRPGPS